MGEYGPVHFRPHFHLLLFFNSSEIADVLRECHNKSWKLGRSDIQRSNGGCASYVASYVNSLASAPALYRSCRAFKPRSRAPLDFLRKARHLTRVKMSMRRLRRKSIRSLMDESIILMASLSAQLPPYRISVPYSPDSRELAMMIMLRYIELLVLSQQRQKESHASVS